MPDDAYHPPESPDQEAAEKQHGDAEGPFGIDMTHLKGGTRAPGDHPAAETSASPYSTGTSSDDGRSVTPQDARTRRDGAGSGQPQDDTTGSR